MEEQESSQKLGQIIGKAWADDAFKQRLLTDTMAVLREEGIEVQPNVEVRAVEQTKKLVYLVIPQKPNPQFTDEELLGIATSRMMASTKHCDTDCKMIGGSI